MFLRQLTKQVIIYIHYKMVVNGGGGGDKQNFLKNIFYNSIYLYKLFYVYTVIY